MEAACALLVLDVAGVSLASCRRWRHWRSRSTGHGPSLRRPPGTAPALRFGQEAPKQCPPAHAAVRTLGSAGRPDRTGRLRPAALQAGDDHVERLAHESDPVRAAVEIIWNAVDPEAP